MSIVLLFNYYIYKHIFLDYQDNNKEEEKSSWTNCILLAMICIKN